MYSSTQGRWFSSDPVRGQSFDPQSFNRYAYVGNSPVNRIDPRGDCYYWYCGYYGYCYPYWGWYPYYGCSYSSYF